MSMITIELTEDIAKALVSKWCRDNDRILFRHNSCVYCEYSDRPYWAVIAENYKTLSSFHVTGFHVYEDGEVKVIN